MLGENFFFLISSFAVKEFLFKGIVSMVKLGICFVLKSGLGLWDLYQIRKEKNRGGGGVAAQNLSLLPSLEVFISFFSKKEVTTIREFWWVFLFLF